MGLAARGERRKTKRMSPQEPCRRLGTMSLRNNALRRALFTLRPPRLSFTARPIKVHSVRRQSFSARSRRPSGPIIAIITGHSYWPIAGPAPVRLLSHLPRPPKRISKPVMPLPAWELRQGATCRPQWRPAQETGRLSLGKVAELGRRRWSRDGL